MSLLKVIFQGARRLAGKVTVNETLKEAGKTAAKGLGIGAGAFAALTGIGAGFGLGTKLSASSKDPRQRIMEFATSPLLWLIVVLFIMLIIVKKMEK